MLIILFTISMFLSASLLFLVEPMLAKMMLPFLGGTPAVWNASLVFFQAVLLAGYLYAYASLKWLGRRAQITVHLLLVLLPLLVVGLLPPHLPAGWEPPTQSNPTVWIFALLFLAVGMPFFALSANTPMMQRWFGGSGHKHAADPYFLYAASNAGSLVGLLAYPLLLEPLLRLSAQSHLWSYAYVLFVAMTMACAISVWSATPVLDKIPILGRHRATGEHAADPAEEKTTIGAWKERMRWVALAFVPSSLMLGVTTALTTDVAAVPLFWVLPLAIYLVSFVLVFAKRPPFSHAWMSRWLPLILLLGLFPTVSGFKVAFPTLLVLYLLLLFWVAMFCHGELARSRPEIHRLPEFYLWISLGGVLGGVFNSLLAPILFHSVVEFPLALIFTALLLSSRNGSPLAGNEAIWASRKDWLFPLALGACMMALILGVGYFGIKPGFLPAFLFFAYSLFCCLTFRKRPLRFAAGIAAMLLASSFYTGPFGHYLATERSFFGVVRVSNDPGGKFRYLIHNGTLHGVQSLDPARSREPLAYYTRSGPAGQILRAMQARMPRGDWAFVGLGAGAMACYLQPGQTLTYYEIDPLVVRFAEDPHYFTFLKQCAPQAKIVLGDARLELQHAPDAKYGLIVVDAFSGDSIPMHLVTREALALYKSKLAPGGILAFHISSNFLTLGPTLGDLAHDGRLLCLIEDDTGVTQAQSKNGKAPSLWVAMARNQGDVATLIAEKGSSAQWLPLPPRSKPAVWTDDYSNLLSVIKWGWNRH